jgi:uncharacterized protein
MAKLIFLNLPVSDVPRATAFYEAIGAVRDPRFCTEDCSMMAFSDTIHFMLLTHQRYADFTSKTIVDARTASEVLIALTEDSRADIDATLAKAVAAGATADPTPPQEMGDFMYGRSFEDLDGHIIELAWMDVDAAMAAAAPGETEPA